MTDDQTLTAAREALAQLALPDGTPLMESSRLSGPVRVGNRLSMMCRRCSAEYSVHPPISSRVRPQP